MADTFPPPDPFVPDQEAPPALTTPVPEPLVGEGSPFAVADAENRDRILDWWRAWWLRVFFPWIKSWVDYFNQNWIRLAEYLNTWITAASEYITLHAVAGHSWWKTTTPLNLTGTTDVELPYDEYRPLQIGDLVSDSTLNTTWGQITALIDDTHATVTTIGSLRGATGFSWWTTATPITQSGTPTNVVLPVSTDHAPQVGDLVVDNSAQSAYGKITAVTDATHVTVSYIHNLQGPQGPAGGGGGGGGVTSIQAGAHIAVDATNPASPIVSVTGMPIGIPAGGASNQALRKISGTDYDAGWADVHEVPNGGASGYSLVKTAGADQALGWAKMMPDPVSPGFAGQALMKNSGAADDIVWANIVGAYSTPTIAAPGGAFLNGTITTPYKLLNLYLATSSAATQRLRIYRSSADRTTDASRAAGTAPSVRGICLAEFIWGSGDAGVSFFTEGLMFPTTDSTPGQLFYRVDSAAASNFTAFFYGVGNV